MRRVSRWAGVVALATMTAGSAGAQTQLSANLSTSQEPPPVNLTTATGAARATPFGTATFTLNAAQTQMTMFVSVFNIDVTGTQTADANDNLVAAHIHCCTALNPGANAGVRWGFFGAPDNDVNPDQLVVTPLVGGIGGSFSSIWDLAEGNAGQTLATSLAGILAGQSYINFHTTQNPGGEIRGAIAVVPEPSTYVLMASGLAGVGLIARRRRA